MTTGNFTYSAYRAAILGRTTEYTLPDLGANTIRASFSDSAVHVPAQGTVVGSLGDIFVSVYTLNPLFAAPPPALGTKTIATTTIGTFNAATITFTGASVVTTSALQFEDLIIYKDTGAAATSPCLYHFDSTGGVTGMPLTPNGADVTVVWNASGISQH